MPHIKIDTPCCDDEIELRLKMHGSYHPGSRTLPPAFPEMDREEVPVTCPSCLHVFTMEEWGALDEKANHAMNNYDWFSDWCDMTTAREHDDE